MTGREIKLKRTIVAIAVTLVMGVLTVPVAFVSTVRAQTNQDPTVLAYDDFDGGLGLDWEVLHCDFSHWSLSKHPGTLTITTQDGAFTSSRTNYKNLFLIDCPAVPGKDFTSTICVTLKPADEFNQAGLILYSGLSHCPRGSMRPGIGLR